MHASVVHLLVVCWKKRGTIEYNSAAGFSIPKMDPPRRVSLHEWSFKKIKIEKNFVFRLLCVLATYIYIYIQKNALCIIEIALQKKRRAASGRLSKAAIFI